MPPSTFSYTSADGTPIAAYRWDPAGEPRALRGVVQLTHPDSALASTQRQEAPARCHIVPVLCGSMSHRAGYAKRDQPP